MLASLCVDCPCPVWDVAERLRVAFAVRAPSCAQIGHRYFVALWIIVMASCRVISPCGALPSVMPAAFAAAQSFAAHVETGFVRSCAK